MFKPAKQAAEYSPGWSEAEPGVCVAEHFGSPRSGRRTAMPFLVFGIRRPLRGLAISRAGFPGFRFAPPGAYSAARCAGSPLNLYDDAFFTVN